MNGSKVLLNGRMALIAFVLLVIAFLVYALIPRMDSDSARQTLTEAGYTRIEITGPASNAPLCTRDDWYRTGFNATAPDGKTVSGYVCSGKYAPTIFQVQ